MNNLDIKTKYNGIDVECSFNNKLNILRGSSGSGKSLLLTAIDFYCTFNKISCRLCNYDIAGLRPDTIISICEDVEVVLLDNADLYLTEDILKAILKTAKFVIMSIKNTDGISIDGASEYLVEHKDLHVKTIKL